MVGQGARQRPGRGPTAAVANSAGENRPTAFGLLADQDRTLQRDAFVVGAPGQGVEVVFLPNQYRRHRSKSIDLK